ncbi:MAG TPA: hypothetical protein PKY82_28495, partial [Pyrinomonadaceae bacterium]|nr:hypothetical protein [Pyrinomonadaceae bacterium]
MLQNLIPDFYREIAANQYQVFILVALVFSLFAILFSGVIAVIQSRLDRNSLESGFLNFLSVILIGFLFGFTVLALEITPRHINHSAHFVFEAIENGEVTVTEYFFDSSKVVLSTIDDEGQIVEIIISKESYNSIVDSNWKFKTFQNQEINCGGEE